MPSNSGPATHRTLSQVIPKALDLLLWALQVPTAALFLVFGANKFDPGGLFWTTLFGKAGATFWIEVFAKIGIGQWFRYFTGGLEIVCAILLLIPRTSAIAAILLSCTMIGAILTHILILRDGLAIVQVCIVLLLITSVVGWKRYGLMLKLGGPGRK